jgi:transcriptional regulator with XRE-family HTH domain
MSKRKPIDKAQVRDRRNRLLESAAAADLSLTEGVREMRAIAGMTQEEFARHRGVSARVIKAIELGQGNPTVATLNRIGQFFGLEVAFVPVRRAAPVEAQNHSANEATTPAATSVPVNVTISDLDREMIALRERVEASARWAADTLETLNRQREMLKRIREHSGSEADLNQRTQPQQHAPEKKKY